MTRQLAAGCAHPDLQVGNQRCDAIPAHGQALIRRQAVDRALGVEDGVDPPHSFNSEWCLGNLCQLEKVAPPVGPTPSRHQRFRLAQRRIEIVEPGVGVSLEDAAVSTQMPLGMFTTAVA